MDFKCGSFSSMPMTAMFFAYLSYLLGYGRKSNGFS